MRIAWIDDDIEIIEPVVNLLREDHEILEYRTVGQALASADDILNADFVLLDMILPPGDLEEEPGHYSGIYLLKSLRERGSTQPVLIFTVVNLDKIKPMAEPFPPVSYLRKPALPTELKKAVEEAARLSTGTGVSR